MIKAIDTASGVNYRFLLKDNVLKGIEISDQTLQQQILSELDRKAVNRDTTFFKTKDGEIFVVCGCFRGTLEEFVRRVKETHKDNKFAKEYFAMIELVKIKFGLL